MDKLLALIAALALLANAGCAGVARVPDASSPCRASEVSYACQVERYQNVNAE